MSPPRDGRSADPAFTREEAWVAHAALLAACERTAGEGREPVAADTPGGSESWRTEWGRGDADGHEHGTDDSAPNTDGADEETPDGDPFGVIGPERVDTGAGRALPHRRPLRRIEQGEPLGPAETALLHDALVEYLGDAPVRDRAVGRALLRRTAAATGASAGET